MTPLLGDPVSFVISLNLKRRHLTEGQLGMIALKAKPLLEKEARERMLAGKTLGPMGPRVGRGKSAAFAGAAVGVSGQTVRRAQLVASQGIPELAQAVRAGNITVRAAAEAKARMLSTLKHGDKSPLPPMGGSGKSNEMAGKLAGQAVGVSQQTVNRAQAAAAVNVSARSVDVKSCAPAAAGATSGTPEPPTPPRPAAGVVRRFCEGAGPVVGLSGTSPTGGVQRHATGPRLSRSDRREEGRRNEKAG